MKGRNKLTVSRDTMEAALQHYLSTVLFKPSACPKVVDVAPSGSYGYEYEVSVEGRTDGPDAD